jgi:hypothetical protein
VFNQLVTEVENSIPDFDEMTSLELMDIFKKVLLMNGVDQEFFKLVIGNVLDSSKSSSFTEILKRLTQFFRNSQDSALALIHDKGYAALGNYKNSIPSLKPSQITATCFDCKSNFPYSIQAHSGLPLQRCAGCHTRHNLSRAGSNKNEKVPKNHSLSELYAMQEAQRKAALTETETKLANTKITTPKLIPAFKKKVIVPQTKRSTHNNHRNEGEADELSEFGVESGDESF